MGLPTVEPATQGSRRRNGAVASASPNADDHVDSQIRRLYEDEGCTGAEIARQVGCGTTTVYARLARLGIGRRQPTPRRRGRPNDDELRRLYEDHGLSLRQIARHFSVTPQAVRSWMVAAGIPRRPPGAVAVSAASERIVALYRQGLGAPQIAARLGCSPATVYRRLTAAGVERRRGPAVDRQMLLDGLAAGLSVRRWPSGSG